MFGFVHDAIGGSIFGDIDYRGCANFTDDAAHGGDAGAAGRAGQAGGGYPMPGVTGMAGIDGLSGQVDPIGFAPYPSPAGPPVEGPPGSPICSDGVDNDNDGLIDGADPGCQTPDPRKLEDEGPQARLLGPIRRKLAKKVVVTVACDDEACTATVSGSVDVADTGTGQRTELAPVTKAIRKGRKARLKLKLDRNLARAIRSALRAHQQATVDVEVVVTNAAGKSRVLGRELELRR